MSIDLAAIGEVFAKQGYARTRDTVKLEEFKAPTTGQYAYVYKERDHATAIQVVIHPALKAQRLLRLPGVTSPADNFRHGSNMRQFPKRLHRGETETHYGRAILIDSLEALGRFLQLFDTPAGSEREGADLPPRITAIELQNFKGVGDRIRIELAPITLLFGANSAGKSTVLQALQYVREVLERRNANPDRTLHGGDFVDLGGFGNLVHQRDLGKSIGIKLEMELNRAFLPELVPEAFDEWQTHEKGVWEFYELLQDTKNRTESVSVSLEVGWSIERQAAVVIGYEAGANGHWVARIAASEDGCDASVTINQQNPVFLRYWDQNEIESNARLESERADVVPSSTNNENEKQLEDSYDRLVSSDVGEHAYSVYPTIRIALDDAGIEKPGQGFRQWLQGFDGALPRLEPLLYTPTGHAIGASAVYLAREFTGFLSSMLVGPAVLIRDQLRKLRYLGPIRHVPPRNFMPALSSDEKRWADGTGAWDALATGERQLVDEVSNWMSSPERLATGYEVEQTRFKEVNSGALNWLIQSTENDALPRNDPALSRELRAIVERRRFDLVDTLTGVKVHPRDVGIGISQVLPVVVAALDRSALLVTIEQPELHVHPAIQVGLGDLLVHSSKTYGTSFLIETHSEHMILRLLRRIRETAAGTLPPSALPVRPEDIAVIHLQKSSDGIQAVLIPLDTSGDFTSQWPNGFFTERMGELL